MMVEIWHRTTSYLVSLGCPVAPTPIWRGQRGARNSNHDNNNDDNRNDNDNSDNMLYRCL